MDNDKKHGEGMLRIGQAGNMEVAAAVWTIQLAAPSTATTGTTQPATAATLAAPAAMEAT